MLTAYIQAAMRRATYELLPDDEGYYGEIPLLEGVFATAATLEDCREELRSVLEGWIILGLS
ncbi:MAG: type II toxin-antitoxin system HicB family antitoxin, partial [Chromatiaceae bacterium]